MAAEPALDLVTLGRSSVDLYGEQVGGRLEDMASFAKYLGGCPTNIAAGTARLGLRPALITRVGDEHMGRFVREELAREGVDVRGVTTDPERLTSLVVLGIRDRETFPLIFYRDNCADSALEPDDVDEELVASARALVVTGTHFSKPNLDAASRKAMRVAGEHGRTIVLDVDYRPVLWGLTGHGSGEERFVANTSVTGHLQTILPDCDVVVGTEEELHVAGGSTDTLAAIRRVRELTPALIVVKRGPMGCVAFEGAIPASIEDGVKGPGFPVEVYNVLGAGDAFMSGFLRGYLRDLPLEECCRLANACGAIVVSRHGCTPAMPSWDELRHFLRVGSEHRSLRLDAELERLHRTSNGKGDWPEVVAFAFDHRKQLEDMADALGADRARIGAFKRLCWRAAKAGAAGRAGGGILCDGRLGREALDAATGSGAWIARPIELPGSVPLRFEGGEDVGSTLREWPVEHVVKCLVFYHPDDDAALRDDHERSLVRLSDACRATGHELLVEVIASKSGKPCDAATVAGVMDRLYDLGVYPDWWKLEAPEEDAGWQATAAVVERRDPYCRGVVLLGLDAPEEGFAEVFRRARRHPVCKGFAIGRTVFGAPARAWFAGEIGDNEAVERMAATYRRLIGVWDEAGRER